MKYGIFSVYRKGEILMKLIITEREKLKQQILYLQETYDVERKFMSILEWEKDAFWDEDSLQLMKEIDGAVRCESYGVVTPIGASCISCLSTGCKFGLIVLHHIKKKYSTKIVVNYWVAGENVWEWLMAHTDATLYILEEDFDIYFIKTKYDNLKIRYRKKWYNSSDSKVWEIASKCQDKPYILTKETENQAYERHCRLADKEIFCDIKEEIYLDKFLERFGKNEYFPWDEQWDEVKDYKVINYCNYIPIKFLHKKHPLYVCGTKSGEMEIFHELTVKYPEFWEVLLY